MSTQTRRRPRPIPKEIDVRSKHRSRDQSWRARTEDWLWSTAQTVRDVSAIGWWAVQGMPPESDPARRLLEKKRAKTPPGPGRTPEKSSKGTGRYFGSEEEREPPATSLDAEVREQLDKIQELLAKLRARDMRSEQLLEMMAWEGVEDGEMDSPRRHEIIHSLGRDFESFAAAHRSPAYRGVSRGVNRRLDTSAFSSATSSVVGSTASSLVSSLQSTPASSLLSTPASSVQNTPQKLQKGWRRDTRADPEAEGGGDGRKSVSGRVRRGLRTCSKDEATLLAGKIRHRRYEDVQKMLASGIDTETRDEFGNTLLMLAAQAGSKRMCKILLREGADINAQNDKGNTAMHFCHAFNYKELGVYLQSKNGDVSITNLNGLTCFEGLEHGHSAKRVSFSLDKDGQPIDAVTHAQLSLQCDTASADADPQHDNEAAAAARAGTIVINAIEYQRLKALVTPATPLVQVVGDTVVVQRKEYDRLHREAEIAREANLTPRSWGRYSIAPPRGLMRSPNKSSRRKGVRRNPIMLESVPGSPIYTDMLEGEGEGEEYSESTDDITTSGGSSPWISGEIVSVSEDFVSGVEDSDIYKDAHAHLRGSVESWRSSQLSQGHHSESGMLSRRDTDPQPWREGMRGGSGDEQACEEAEWQVHRTDLYHFGSGISSRGDVPAGSPSVMMFTGLAVARGASSPSGSQQSDSSSSTRGPSPRQSTSPLDNRKAAAAGHVAARPRMNSHNSINSHSSGGAASPEAEQYEEEGRCGIKRSRHGTYEGGTQGSIEPYSQSSQRDLFYDPSPLPDNVDVPMPMPMDSTVLREGHGAHGQPADSYASEQHLSGVNMDSAQVREAGAAARAACGGAPPVPRIPIAQMRSRSAGQDPKSDAMGALISPRDPRSGEPVGTNASRYTEIHDPKTSQPFLSPRRAAPLAPHNEPRSGQPVGQGKVRPETPRDPAKSSCDAARGGASFGSPEEASEAGSVRSLHGSVSGSVRRALSADLLVDVSDLSSTDGTDGEHTKTGSLFSPDGDKTCSLEGAGTVQTSPMYTTTGTPSSCTSGWFGSQESVSDETAVTRRNSQESVEVRGGGLGTLSEAGEAEAAVMHPHGIRAIEAQNKKSYRVGVEDVGVVHGGGKLGSPQRTPRQKGSLGASQGHFGTGEEEGVGAAQEGAAAVQAGGDPIIGPILIPHDPTSPPKPNMPALGHSSGPPPPPPAPPPPGSAAGRAAGAPPPPPPPPPSTAAAPPPPPPPGGAPAEPPPQGRVGRSGSGKKIEKSWKVIEDFQSFVKIADSNGRDETPQRGRSNSLGRSKRGGGEGGGAAAVMEELAGKSAYMKQVLGDRTKYKEMIEDLAKQISDFKPRSVEQVCAFVDEVERRLGLLADELAVLKAFEQWPEQRLEAMRELVSRHRELTALRDSVDVAKWTPRATVAEELQRTQEVFTRTQATVDWFLRVKEDMSAKWRRHGLPFDFGLLTDVRHASVDMAEHVMRLALAEHEQLGEGGAEARGRRGASAEVHSLMDSALRLSFRCHQSAGGFNEEASEMFSLLQAKLVSRLSVDAAAGVST